VPARRRSPKRPDVGPLSAPYSATWAWSTGVAWPRSRRPRLVPLGPVTRIVKYSRRSLSMTYICPAPSYSPARRPAPAILQLDRGLRRHRGPNSFLPGLRRTQYHLKCLGHRPTPAPTASASLLSSWYEAPSSASAVFEDAAPTIGGHRPALHPGRARTAKVRSPRPPQRVFFIPSARDQCLSFLPSSKDISRLVIVPSTAVETMGLGGMLATASLGGAKP
jgi:hypothetical protein